MAVTIRLPELRNAIRTEQSSEEDQILTRLLAVGTALVERAAPDAPDEVANEAVVRVSAYLYDQPPAARNNGTSNALRNSGAAGLLLPWRTHRAGSTGPSTSSSSPTTTSSNGSGLDTDGVNALIAPWSRAGNPEQIPANKLLLAGGGGVSATADLLIERLGTLDGPILPANRVWIATGIMIPATLHVLLLDAGQVSDDFHLVDWDQVMTHPAGTAGNVSAPGEFETFAGDAFTVLRIGHDADNELLIANESTSALTLLHIHVERLLTPLAVGTGGDGTDQVARDAATAAQATAAQALQDDDVESWAQTDHPGTKIPASKLPPTVGLSSFHEGARLQAPPRVMRAGWNQSRTIPVGVFVRADDHPIDGAALGMTSPGLEIPPAPPALDTDATLFLALWIAGDTVDGTRILQGDIDLTDTFRTPAALTVGEAGHYWVTKERLAHATARTITVELPGDFILGTSDVSSWARTGNDTAIPADKLANAPAGGGTGTGGGPIFTKIVDQTTQLLASQINEWFFVGGQYDRTTVPADQWWLVRYIKFNTAATDKETDSLYQLLHTSDIPSASFTGGFTEGVNAITGSGYHPIAGNASLRFIKDTADDSLLFAVSNTRKTFIDIWRVAGTSGVDQTVEDRIAALENAPAPTAPASSGPVWDTIFTHTTVTWPAVSRFELAAGTSRTMHTHWNSGVYHSIGIDAVYNAVNGSKRQYTAVVPIRTSAPYGENVNNGANQMLIKFSFADNNTGNDSEQGYMRFGDNATGKLLIGFTSATSFNPNQVWRVSGIRG